MKTLLNVSLLILVVFPARLAAHHIGPLAVLDARQAAYDAHNVEAAVAFFADDAVVTLAVGTPRQVQYVGKEQIRRWQEALQKEQSVRTELLGERKVDGEIVTWRARVSRDEWRRMGIASLEFWGEATVRGGKITSLRNGPTQEAAEKLR